MFLPRRLDDRVSVAPQIASDDIPAIKTAGFVAVINNRPDDEEPDQPAGVVIRAAAEAVGLGYHEIPVRAGFSPAMLEATRQVLADAGGPVLAYCRSGTRSCNLWALASAQGGADPTALIDQAAIAGYDLRGLREILIQLSARS